MAKKKSRKRGWSGAPPARSSSGSRPTGVTTQPSAATPAASVATENGEEPAPTRTAAKPAAPKPAAPKTSAAKTSARQAPQPTSHRTARKEEARKQREMLRRKAARQRTMRRVGIIGGIVVAVLAVGAVILLTRKEPVDLAKIDPHTLPGVTADQAPWPAETTQLSARIEKMGLPPLGGEQLAYHIHQNLVVYINGTQEPVPAGLGFIPPRSFAEIHTHDSSGTIHIEAGATRRFTLGNVFDVWGVLLTKDQIGAYKVEGDKQIRIWVNGKPYKGDPRLVPLGDQEVIVVTYGTPAQVPKQIPSVFHYAQPPTVPGAKASSTPSTPSTTPSSSAVPSASPS